MAWLAQPFVWLRNKLGRNKYGEYNPYTDPANRHRPQGNPQAAPRRPANGPAYISGYPPNAPHIPAGNQPYGGWGLSKPTRPARREYSRHQDMEGFFEAEGGLHE